MSYLLIWLLSLHFKKLNLKYLESLKLFYINKKIMKRTCFPQHILVCYWIVVDMSTAFPTKISSGPQLVPSPSRTWAILPTLPFWWCRSSNRMMFLQLLLWHLGVDILDWAEQKVDGWMMKRGERKRKREGKFCSRSLVAAEWEIRTNSYFWKIVEYQLHQQQSTTANNLLKLKMWCESLSGIWFHLELFFQTSHLFSHLPTHREIPKK